MLQTSIEQMFRAALVAAGVTMGAMAHSTDVSAAHDSPLEVKAELDRSILVQGETQKAFVRISVTPARHANAKRPLMNIALVVDRSGSMSAHGRIENARRAAAMAVDRMGRDDILALVSYDDKIEVDVPATKVTSRGDIKSRIDKLTPRGSTAIHAALLAGANEVRKFKTSDRVNRIILISDGLANVGPSKPQDFVSLGRELASEGITVSTIGLGTGYNEDLMAGLAKSADGGHVFVQESADLAQFLARELDDAAGTVGQEAEIIIKVKDGVKPLRSLGRDAEITGDRIIFRVGTLLGGVEQVLLAELEVAASAARDAEALASVEVAYADSASGTRHVTSTSISARFEIDRDRSEKSANAVVQRDVATLTSRAARSEAVKLRDAGKIDEARAKFRANAEVVRQWQSRLPGGASYAPLKGELEASEAAAAPEAQSGEGWSKARKTQRAIDSNQFGASIKY